MSTPHLILLLLVSLVFTACQSSKTKIIGRMPPERMPVLIGGFEGLEQHLVYPEAARKAGIEGRLSLVFTVTVEGAVRDVSVVESTRLGYGLDEEAIRVMRLARFEPGKDEEGNPMEMKLALPVTFKLREAEKLNGALRGKDGS